LGGVAEGDRLPPLEVEVTPTTVVLGALASRDWRPMHHDYRFATERNGVADIFLNTPNQAAWFERYLTDWTGPRGRVGRMTFRMRDSVFPGDVMTFTGTVRSEVELRATHETRGDRLCSTCTARIAVPVDESDNPWARAGDRWRP
jgi:acyl dehydratase